MADINSEQNLEDSQVRPEIDKLYRENEQKLEINHLAHYFAWASTKPSKMFSAAVAISAAIAGGIIGMSKLGESIDAEVLRILSRNSNGPSAIYSLSYIDLKDLGNASLRNMVMGEIPYSYCPITFQFEDGSSFVMREGDNFGYSGVRNTQTSEERDFNLNFGLTNIKLQDDRLFGIDNLPASGSESGSYLQIFEGTNFEQRAVHIDGTIMNYRVAENGIILVQSISNVYRIDINSTEPIIEPLINPRKIPEGTSLVVDAINISPDGNNSLLLHSNTDNLLFPDSAQIINHSNPVASFRVDGIFRGSQFGENNEVILFGEDFAEAADLRTGIHVYNLATGNKARFIRADALMNYPVMYSQVEGNELITVTAQGNIAIYNLETGETIYNERVNPSLQYNVIDICEI